jgi:hypothetical protein
LSRATVRKLIVFSLDVEGAARGHPDASRVGWVIAGAIILGVVAIITFVGVVVAGLAISAVFGAELWKRLRTA